MPARILTLALVICLMACATPKYSYYFDYVKYPPKKDKPEREENTLKLDETALVASHSPAVNAVVEPAVQSQRVEAGKTALIEKNSKPVYAKPSKKLKQELKSIIKDIKGKEAAEPAISSKPKQDSKKNGFAIAGFVCSLVSWFVLWPLAIVGIIFSAIGLKSERKGLAIAGLVLGIVGIVLFVALSGQA